MAQAQHNLAKLCKDSGQASAEHGEYKEAVAALSKAAELSPNDLTIRYQLGIAYLALDDTTNYKLLCQAMVKEFGRTKEAKGADRILYTCVSSAHADLDANELVRLAALAATLYKGNERILGAAFYRAHDYAAALEQFNKSTIFLARPWDCFFLAMIHHRLGHPKEARDFFQKGVTEMDRLSCSWTERVEMQQLRKEAQALIEGDKESKTGNGSK